MEQLTKEQREEIFKTALEVLRRFKSIEEAKMFHKWLKARFQEDKGKEFLVVNDDKKILKTIRGYRPLEQESAQKRDERLITTLLTCNIHDLKYVAESLEWEISKEVSLINHAVWLGRASMLLACYYLFRPETEHFSLFEGFCFVTFLLGLLANLLPWYFSSGISELKSIVSLVRKTVALKTER